MVGRVGTDEWLEVEVGMEEDEGRRTDRGFEGLHCMKTSVQPQEGCYIIPLVDCE